MIAVLLSVLKIIGIILLCVLLLLIALLLLVLFVPIRYQAKGFRKEGDEVPVRVAVKVTWLLHLVNAAFRYPEEAYLKVRIFCFTVFSTKEKDIKEKEAEKNKEQKKEVPKSESRQANVNQEVPREENGPEKAKAEEQQRGTETEKEQEIYEEEQEEPTLIKFIKKLFDILKNIKYTICKLYDKIRHIIKNIRYYIKIVKSNSFQRAWKLCRSEALLLVKGILPKKLNADFVIGTGDPASTAQILSVQGILYPLLGDHVRITPDFDNKIVEGDFLLKGKITVFKILKTAIKIYFNKDLRRVIRLFKKEAV